MNRLKWAILGPGAMATDFAKAIIEANGSIYAVGARTLAKAQAFARSYPIANTYGSYEALLKDAEIDVVYIATPHSNHYEYIMASLQNNKHVFCEKAITVNSQQLRQIVNLAAQKKLVVAEAMTIYHMPLYKKIRTIMNSGQIGKLKMIQVSFGSCKEYDVTKRFFREELAGGALLDIGTYALSFTRYFLSSQPNEILTTMKRFETGVDEQSAIILKNSGDEMAVISLTMRAKMPKRGIIVGELGFITVDDFPRAAKATINYLDGKVEVLEVGDTAQALVYEVEDMNHYIANRNADTVALSIDVMSIMDEVRRQWGLKYSFE
jgi:predicted dehydrogenase